MECSPQSLGMQYAHEKKASAIKKHGIDRQSVNSDSEDLDLGKRSFFMTNISTTTHPRLLQP